MASLAWREESEANRLVASASAREDVEPRFAKRKQATSGDGHAPGPKSKVHSDQRNDEPKAAAGNKTLAARGLGKLAAVECLKVLGYLLLLEARTLAGSNLLPVSPQTPQRLEL